MDYSFYLFSFVLWLVIIGIILAVAAAKKNLNREFASNTFKIGAFFLILLFVGAAAKDLLEHNSAYIGSVVILVVALVIWAFWSAIIYYELARYRKEERAARERKEDR